MIYKISDLGTVYSGGTPSTKKADYWDGNIAWITPKDLANYSKKHISHGERSITEDGLRNSSAVLIPKGAVLMSSRAPIGYVVIANNDVTTNQGFKSILCDEKKCLNEYMYYWIKSNTDYIKTKANGSTFKEISGSSFKSLEINLPDLNTQKKIVYLLSKLDQKIELNEKENSNLEKIIETQYKTFLSTRDSKSKEYKAIDLFSYDGGYSYSSAELVEKSPTGMMTIKNFERTGGFKVDGFKPLKPRKTKVPDANIFDIFIACTDVTQNADIIGNAVMLLNKDDYENITYSMDLAKIEPKINKYTLYAILNSKDFKNFALGYKSGTTVLHLSKKCLKEYAIKLPEKEKIDSFGEIVEKSCKKISNNIAENHFLSKIRDVLLPKLMSGEIDLSKVTLDE